MSGQQLTAGAVVTITGRTLYEVIRVTPLGPGDSPSRQLVYLRSRSSGRQYSEYAGRLCWPGGSSGTLGEPVAPPHWRAPRAYRDGSYEQHASGAVRVDGLTVRSADSLAAAVVSDKRPSGWSSQTWPHAVGLAVTSDNTGCRFLRVVTAGHHPSSAYLDADAAHELAASLFALLDGLPGRPRQAP